MRWRRRRSPTSSSTSWATPRRRSAVGSCAPREPEQVMGAGTGPAAGPLAAVPKGGGVTGNGRELGGSFPLGPWHVSRAGYGAMQLAGDGVFGPPRDRDEALRVLLAAAAARGEHIR